MNDQTTPPTPAKSTPAPRSMYNYNTFVVEMILGILIVAATIAGSVISFTRGG